MRRHRIPALAATAVCLATAALAGPATAAEPLAVEAGGRSHYAFVTKDRKKILVRRQAADGTLDARAVAYAAPANQQVSSLTGIAVDSLGRETIVWKEQMPGGTEALRGRRRAANGAFYPVKTFATGTYDGDFGIDRAGNAILAWSSRYAGVNTVQVQRWGAGGALSDVKPLSTYYATFYPSVAVNPSGAAVIAFGRAGGGLVARRRSASGVIGPLKLVDGFYSYGITVQIADSGAAMFKYSESFRPMDANGNLGPEGPGGDSMDLAPDGSAAWGAREYDEGGWAVKLRRRSAAGVLSGLQMVEAGAGLGAAPAVELESGGAADLVWRAKPSSDASLYPLNARRVAADGTLGDVRTLAEPAHSQFLRSIGEAADGTLTYFWQTTDENGTIRQLARRQAPDGGPFGPLTTVDVAP